ncbi:MAG TPA: hypothetical protein VMV22_05805 [Acidimicrobiales bacterium]|nr:hypothetical protein [Acidimicrobiales bacterium]
MAGAPPVTTTATRPRRALRRAMSDQEKQERHDDILAAAKRMFARMGYHSTTIADHPTRRCAPRCGRRSSSSGPTRPS